MTTGERPVDASGAPVCAFLRAKYAWERGDVDTAMHDLEGILAGGENAPPLYVPPRLIDGSRAAMRFEDLVAFAVSTDEYLLMPFGQAIARLWDAFPAQYVLSCMNRRQADEGDLDEDAIEIVYRAAADGLLSVDRRDYGAVARLVLDAEDHALLAPRLDWDRLTSSMAVAAARNAWQAFLGAHDELVANLLLYAVFHKARRMDANMVLDGLDAVIARQPQVIDVAARALARWLASGADPTEVVRIGMRVEPPSSACLASFVAAIREGELDEFATRCLKGLGR